MPLTCTKRLTISLENTSFVPISDSIRNEILDEIQSSQQCSLTPQMRLSNRRFLPNSDTLKEQNPRMRYKPLESSNHHSNAPQLHE
jgi:hypothetical protein